MHRKELLSDTAPGLPRVVAVRRFVAVAIPRTAAFVKQILDSCGRLLFDKRRPTIWNFLKRSKMKLTCYSGGCSRWPLGDLLLFKPSQRNRVVILVASDNPGSDRIGFAHGLEVLGSNHLEQLSVKSAAAHRRHGHALIEAVMSESKLRGCKRVTVRMVANLLWNAPFY